MPNLWGLVETSILRVQFARYAHAQTVWPVLRVALAEFEQLLHGIAARGLAARDVSRSSQAIPRHVLQKPNCMYVYLQLWDQPGDNTGANEKARLVA